MELTPLFSTAYLPPLSFFAAAARYDAITIEACENYPKQTYRNRCRILGPNGVQVLSIPTLKTEDPKRLIKEVSIDYTERWQQVHWRSILTAYSKSPYFMYYRDALEVFYESENQLLIDFNHGFLLLILKLMKLKCTILYTDEFVGIGRHPMDFRYTISPKKDSMVHFPPYYQVFRDRMGFIPDLSILDLLLNLGPDALNYLQGLDLQKNEIPLP